MVDYKTLKIGNYLVKENGELCTVKSLVCEESGECLINGKKPEAYSPVTLTEELVTKCGFIYSGKDNASRQYRHFVTSLGISMVDDKFYFVYCDKIGDLILEDKISIRIECLHRLQNLFYCLSGKHHLTVKM